MGLKNTFNFQGSMTLSTLEEDIPRSIPLLFLDGMQ